VKIRQLNGRTILEWILGKILGRAYTELFWLRIGTRNFYLWAWKWYFGFNETRGISFVVEVERNF